MKVVGLKVAVSAAHLNALAPTATHLWRQRRNREPRSALTMHNRLLMFAVVVIVVLAWVFIVGGLAWLLIGRPPPAG